MANDSTCLEGQDKILNKGLKTMTIAGHIRNYLKMYPAGVTTREVHQYCISKGAVFRVSDHRLQLKSVSGQLSKMRARGEVGYSKEGKGYRWFVR